MESFGCKLFSQFKLRQGSYFKSSIFDSELRKKWTESFPKQNIRGNVTKFKDSSVLILITQDCDIACKRDDTESSLEFLVCKKIKPQDVFSGNQFVNSVRKLHFSLKGINYEANVDYILTILKEEFFKQLEEQSSSIKDFIPVPDDVLESFKVWRTNRYSRTALPDKFNIKLKPIIDKCIPKLTDISLDEHGNNFIRAIYVRLNSMDELDTYTFSFFALLRTDTPNDVFSSIYDEMDDMCLALSEIGYTCDSDCYVGRDNATYVSELTSYVRFNLDTHSLQNGDYEPELNEL